MNAPRFTIYDIVEIRTSDPPDSLLVGKKGFVDAVRREASGEWVYVVEVCDEGIGRSCPESMSRVFTESELKPTGERYREAVYRDGQWPPRSVPKFQRYEVVEVRSSDPTRQAWAGRAAVIAEIPEQSPDGGWWCALSRYEDSSAYAGLGEVLWDVPEDELVSLGRMSKQYTLEMEHPPRFALGESIVVKATKRSEHGIDGRMGVVAGRADQNKRGEWSYAISLAGVPDVWSVNEPALTPANAYDRAWNSE